MLCKRFKAFGHTRTASLRSVVFGTIYFGASERLESQTRGHNFIQWLIVVLLTISLLALMHRKKGGKKTSPMPSSIVALCLEHGNFDPFAFLTSTVVFFFFRSALLLLPKVKRKSRTHAYKHLVYIKIYSPLQFFSVILFS